MSILGDIAVGIHVAFSEYPIVRRRRRKKPEIIDGTNDVVEFFIRVNGIIPEGDILHNAKDVDPSSVGAQEGRIVMDGISSCGVRGPMRAVTLEDAYKGKWCPKCFPEAEKMQRMLKA